MGSGDKARRRSAVKRRRVPRPLSIVRFKHKNHSPESIEKYYKDLVGKQFIFLGCAP